MSVGMSGVAAERPWPACCLVCTRELREPFQESESLIHRYVLLAQTFCKYLQLQGDLHIIANEFPFCDICKIALVELKGLDAEIMTLVRRTSFIKCNFTAKMVESQRAQVESASTSPGLNSRFGDLGNQSGRATQPATQPILTFSQPTYKEVTRLRNSIFDRYDVAVELLQMEEFSTVQPDVLLAETKQEVEYSDSNSWTCDNADSLSPHHDLETAENWNEENWNTSMQTYDSNPEIIISNLKCADDRTVQFENSTESVVPTPRESFATDDMTSKELREENALRQSFKSPSDADLIVECNSDHSESDNNGSAPAAVRVLRNKTIIQTRVSKPRSESVGVKHLESSEFVEVSPGMFLYAGKFNVEKKEDKYYCGSCEYKTDVPGSILKHVRRHAKRNVSGKPRRKLVKTESQKLLYANKYEIEIIDGRYVCRECGLHRKGKYKLIEHIRNVHIKNLPPPKYITENLSQSSEHIEETDTPGSNSVEIMDSSNADVSITNKTVKMINYYEGKTRIYREISAGKWLYDNRFSFEKDGTIFRCGSCEVAVFQDFRGIVNHVRKYHYLHQSTKPPINRLREITPNKFLYGGKYNIDLIDGLYICCLCDFRHKARHKTCDHIKKVHIRNLPARTSTCRYKEVSSGKWLYDNRFSFENDGTVFRCGSCEDAVFQDLRSIVNHVRKYHYLRPSTKPPINRLREIAPNKFLYGGKYNIDHLDGLYICSLCGFRRKASHKTCDHIRKCHMHNLPVTSTRFPSAKFGLSREISPGQWLYRNEYPFEKIGQSFNCGCCSEKFEDFRRVIGHVKNIHFKGGLRKRRKMVEIEPDKFLYANEFTVEIFEGRWKCATCQHTTKEKFKMLEHLRTEHIHATETWVCDVCGKVFSKKDSFKRHSQIHKSGREMICHVCGKGFKWERNMKKHLLLHTTT